MSHDIFLTTVFCYFDHGVAMKLSKLIDSAYEALYGIFYFISYYHHHHHHRFFYSGLSMKNTVGPLSERENKVQITHMFG